MRLRTPTNIFTLMGGLAAGAAAMYLLDPQTGQRRRQAIAHAADYAVHHTGSAVHGMMHHAGDAVQHAGEAVYDATLSAGEKIGDLAARARRAGEHATAAAGHAVSAATSAAANAALIATPALAEMGRTSATTAVGMHRLVNSYHDSAHYLADRVDQLREALAHHRESASQLHASHLGAMVTPIVAGAKSALSRLAPVARKSPRALPLLPLSIGGVAVLAAGAGAVYLFDPRRGYDRRKALRQGAVGMVSHLGRFARKRGQATRTNAVAVAREVGLAPPQQRISSRDYVSGEQLLLRVRSELARAVADPRQVQVMTDTFGTVTLSGQIVDADRAAILKAVRNTPGVRHVVDSLAAQPQPTGAR